MTANNLATCHASPLAQTGVPIRRAGIVPSSVVSPDYGGPSVAFFALFPDSFDPVSSCNSKDPVSWWMHEIDCMDILRDPVWQFVGVVIALLSACLPFAVHLLRSKRTERAEEQQRAFRQQLQELRFANIRPHAKHKKKLDDGILCANVCSDFFNQFPIEIGLLAANLDIVYTPYNFGASDWISVFERLLKEEYFVIVGESGHGKVRLDTLVNTGPKMKSMVTIVTEAKRRVAGLD